MLACVRAALAKVGHMPGVVIGRPRSAMLPRSVGVLWAFATLTCVADPLHDPFDNGVLDKQRWDRRDIGTSQYSFDPSGRCGRGAIVITARTGEGVGECGAKPCQRLELRERQRRNFGDDVWYAFSFRVDGAFPTSAVESRWVLAQWKEETDASPFVAQRFDNGVLHVTVEDNGKRQLIASSRVGPERIAAFHRTVNALGSARTRQLSGQVRGLMSREARKPLETKQWERIDKQLAPDQAADAVQVLREFAFVDEAQRYAGTNRVVIEPGPQPILPDPTGQWVDMRYRIRGDANGQARVEVWANSALVVTATGHIGHKVQAGPTQYFKFGHYRYPQPGTVHLRFDEYRRGSSAAEVTGACP
jgi:Polysaccharide lyase